MSTISASTTTTTAFKITTDTTGALVFQTGSSPTTAMTIDTAQKVGIGISSPTGTLHVANASASVGQLRLQYTGSNFFEFQAYSDNKLYINNSSGVSQMVFDGSGKIGIGVSSPTAPLTIASATTAAAIHIRGRSDGYGDVIFYDSTGSTQYGFVEGGTTGLNLSAVGATSVLFGTNGSERARITSGGSVGIGTSSPTQKLHVDATNSGIMVTGSGYTTNPAGLLLGQYTSQYVYIQRPANTALDFWDGGTNASMRLDASGNFLVNLGSIASYVGASPVGCIGNAATTGGTNCAAFLHSHASNPYGPFFYFNQASPNNTSNYFLTCNDTTNQKAVIYSNGTFGSRTSTYGGISDIKVKQDIVDASSQWNDIKALRFRKYRFKDDPTGSLQLGLISQEAELVSPGLVFETPDIERDEEGNTVDLGTVTKSVKYSILYMKAVVALQEAMNRIEQLETRLTALEAK
jgi:hypothetical protein